MTLADRAPQWRPTVEQRNQLITMTRWRTRPVPSWSYDLGSAWRLYDAIRAGRIFPDLVDEPRRVRGTGAWA